MKRNLMILSGCAALGAATASAQLDEELLEPGPTYFEGAEVELRALDKITGRYTDFLLRKDQPMVYGSLRIELDVCFQTPPEEVPESAAFLRIYPADSKQVQTMAVPRELTVAEQETVAGVDATERYFSGWMFASSPGLNALEHPVYDVWVINCKAEIPDTPDFGIE